MVIQIDGVIWISGENDRQGKKNQGLCLDFALIILHFQDDYFKDRIKAPAATAVPITPATLGPIACISR